MVGSYLPDYRGTHQQSVGDDAIADIRTAAEEDLLPRNMLGGEGWGACA